MSSRAARAREGMGRRLVDLKVSTAAPQFSPAAQNSIRNVQTRIREIDAALYSKIKQQLCEIRTFTYSILAGSCQFLDSVQEGGYSSEVVAFALEVVKPAVEGCFEEIAKYSGQEGQLKDERLKLTLLEKLKKILVYPEFNEFAVDLNVEVLKKLEKIITSGSLTLYKLPGSERYYGGRVEIEDAVFKSAIKVMEEAGYRHEGDLDGSCFDAKGHVTTIHAKEIAENYDRVVRGHEHFVSNHKDVLLKPIAIKFGNPQSGRLSRAVVITVDAPDVELYRKACGLRKLIPETHVSVFTQEIQPLQSLKTITFAEYLDRTTPYLRRFHEVWEKRNN